VSDHHENYAQRVTFIVHRNDDRQQHARACLSD
jgi:hypothetical protein